MFSTFAEDDQGNGARPEARPTPAGVHDRGSAAGVTVKHFSVFHLVASWVIGCLLIACAHSYHDLPVEEMAGTREGIPCLKLMTFNIRVGAGKEWPFTPLKYLRSSQEKLDNIALVLRELVPNLVALQEVKGEEQARYLATSLNLYWAYVPHGNAEFDWGLALLSEFPIVSYQGRRIYLDDTKPRVALICRLAVDEQTITVVNVHYYPGDYDSQLRRTMDLLADISGPVVLMGDLNLITYERQLAPLRNRLVDTCPVMATTGAESMLAVARAVVRLVAPGPEVARHTPTWPVARA